MAKYKLYSNTVDGITAEGVTDKESTPITNIPKDTANRDWNEYLEWAKTNTAEAAD